MRIALLLAAALGAAPAVAQAPAVPRPAPVDYTNDARWLCLPGQERPLRDPAADDRAQPRRLWHARPLHRRPQRKDRLLHPLSDGQPRPGAQQRPQSRRGRGESLDRFPVRAPVERLPYVRADLPLDDGWRGDRRRDRRRRHRSCRDRVRRCPRRVAQLSHDPQPGPPVRARRPQSGLADADPVARPRYRGPARGQAHEARHPARLQRHGAAGQARRRHLQVDPALRHPRRDQLRP